MSREKRIVNESLFLVESSFKLIKHCEASPT